MSPTPEPGGGADGPPQPKLPDPDYPNRTIDGKYGIGNSLDGKWQEQVALDKYQSETGIPIIRQQVKATHPGVLNQDGPRQKLLVQPEQKNPGRWPGNL